MENKEFTKQYGQVIYASHKVGSSLYAEIRDAHAGYPLVRWHHEPINGKTAIIRECAKKLGGLDWKPVIEQRDKLDHAILHPFVEQVQQIVRGTEGRCFIICPVCLGSKKHAFSEDMQ